jgi:hypothetical protein
MLPPGEHLDTDTDTDTDTDGDAGQVAGDLRFWSRPGTSQERVYAGSVAIDNVSGVCCRSQYSECSRRTP